MEQHAPTCLNILDLLREIVEKSSRGDYIYRGESECFPKISSTLYREYEEQIDAQHFDIDFAQGEMLEQVKAYTSFTDDTDILTELQHYGGKTNLIDFTTDYLIALFFACDSSYDVDGRLILLDKATKQDQIKLPKKNQNNRVISQKSIFVQSPSGCIEDYGVDIVPIPRDLKQAAMEYLKQHHGITTEVIYNDILGYIQNQHKHQSAYAEFFIGYTYFEKGQREEAILHYDQTIALNPRLANAYNNRGVAKKELGRHVEAIADFDEAIRIKPDLAEAYNNRGNAKLDLALHEEAIADYDEAIRIKQDYAEAYSGRGLAKARLGRYEEAIADFDEAIRIRPDYAEAYNNRGNSKIELTRHVEAIKDFDEAIRIRPDYARAYFNRGIAKKLLRQPAAAIEDFRQAQALAQEQGRTDLLHLISQELDDLKSKDADAPPFQVAAHRSGYAPGVDPEELT